MLVQEEHVSLSPAGVFALFGAGHPDVGWLFGATCDRVEPGAVVRFQLPAGPPGGAPAIGRIAAVEPGRRLVLRHEAPWPGLVTFSLIACGGGTRIRVVAEIDDEAVHWLLHRSASDVCSEWREDQLVVGALISQSGPASIYTAASVHLARMAAQELNADGGLCGLSVHVVDADDATDSATGAAAARRLIEADGCSVIFTNVTSETFRAVQPVAAAAGVLLVYTPVNEGGRVGERLIRLGERPADQIRQAVPRLMRETGGSRWALVGSDYSWPRASNGYARRAIGRQGGTVAGEWYAPLGTRDFSPLLERLATSGADLIMSALVGADEVAFERQIHESGLRSRYRVLSLALDEATRQHVGERAAEGLWTVFGYFEQMPSESNAAFLRRYHDFVRLPAQPVSSISESMYEAIHLYADAVRSVRSTDPTTAGRALASARFDGPRGPVRLSGPSRLEQPVYLAESEPGGFRILDQV